MQNLSKWPSSTGRAIVEEEREPQVDACFSEAVPEWQSQASKAEYRESRKYRRAVLGTRDHLDCSLVVAFCLKAEAQFSRGCYVFD